MPKAVWTGSLSFGLVTIPVRLYPATEPKDVRFHLVDREGRRVRYRRFVETEEPAAYVEDARDDSGVTPAIPAEPRSRAEPQPEPQEEVAYADLLRSFERDDGSVVLLEDDEIRSVQPERSRTIDIEDFVDLRDIDPVYFEKSYVVAPQHGAEKPYALLLRAMEGADRAGIGRFVLRTKPHLVAIRPAQGALFLETLFFGDEVRDARRLAGETLIDTLKTTWNPQAYADTYREELLERIAAKAPTDTPHEGVARPPGGQVEALMDALKASVEAAKEKPKRSTRKRTA
jgi:DNA end-binding protein Ku